MQQYGDVVLKANPSGVATMGKKAEVTVYLAGTRTRAALFLDNGGTVLANPFNAQDDGSFKFCAADGSYDLYLGGTFIKTVTLLDAGSSTVAFNVAATHQVFTQDGARIQRFGDRVMVGDAVASDFAFPNVTQDWFTQFQVAAGLANGTILTTQAAVLTTPNSGSAGGFLAAAQTAHFASASTNALANSAYAVNNHASLSTSAWAFYGEAHKTTAASGTTYAMELDTRSLVATIAPTPFQQGTVIALQLASGAGLSGVGQFDASAAIQIESNPVKFKAGIVFGATSITGTDGVTGSGTAMALAKGHALAWYTNDGAQSASIVSQVSSSASSVSLQMNDNGFQFNGPSGVLGYWFRVNNAANYPFVSPNTTGNAVVYGASGSDTDVDLKLAPQGSGVVQFGSYAAGAVAQTGYITFKDGAGNSRRMLVG